MLRWLHWHLAGKQESPWTYGVSRALISFPSCIALSYIQGWPFWEAQGAVMLMSFYWLHRLIKKARDQGREHTLVVADQTTARFANLMAEDRAGGARSESPRLNQEWPDQHRPPGANGQSRAGIWPDRSSRQ